MNTQIEQIQLFVKAMDKRMTREEFEALPDRRTLVHDPVPGAWFRDGDTPDKVVQWIGGWWDRYHVTFLDSAAPAMAAAGGE